MALQCPYCDSESVRESEGDGRGTLPIVPIVRPFHVSLECQNCGKFFDRARATAGYCSPPSEYRHRAA